MKLNWTVKVPPNETDWPDLIIQDIKEEFGLEVRKFFIDETKNGSIKKRKELNNKEIINEIKAEFIQKNLKPINVDFVGDLDHEIKPKIIKKLTSLELNPWEKRVVNINHNDSYVKLFIMGLPDDFRDNYNWRCTKDHIGVVNENPVDEINQIISDKAKKLPKYSQNLKKISLLIFANSSYASGMMRLKSNDSIEACGFHKIYFLHYPYGALVFPEKD